MLQSSQAYYNQSLSILIHQAFLHSFYGIFIGMHWKTMKNRLLLEKESKSSSVKVKEMLSLDVRQQNLEYLHLIVKTALSSKFNP